MDESMKECQFQSIFETISHISTEKGLEMVQKVKFWALSRERYLEPVTFHFLGLKGFLANTVLEEENKV